MGKKLDAFNAAVPDSPIDYNTAYKIYNFLWKIKDKFDLNVETNPEYREFLENERKKSEENASANEQRNI